MSSTTYVVAIDFQQKGDMGLSRLTGGVSRLSGAMNRFSSSASGGISRIVSGIENAVSRAVGLATAFAGWGLAGATAVGGVAAYTVHLNNELERTRISLGAIFSAQGFAPNLQAGLTIANDQIAKMRKDAAALPGEFEDLVGIFRTIAIPGGQAGLNVNQIREMASKVMATGAVTGLPMEQVAREAAMLMSGRAGAHNVFGMRLMGLSGDAAEKFNKMAPDRRVALMSKELDKFAPAIDAFGKSFEGLSTTFIDNLKQFATAASGPLFEKIKSALSSANDWFTKNAAAVKGTAELVGEKLAEAFDVGIAKIKEWWPAIRMFAENAYSRLTEIWTTIQPYVERFGTALQNALKDPGTIDKLVHLAELWAAIKIGQGLVGAAGVGMSLLGGAGKVAAVGGAGFLAGRAMLGGAITSITGGMGITGLGSLGPAALTAGATLGSLTLAAGGVYLAFKQWEALQDDLAKYGDDDQKNQQAREEWAQRTIASYTDQVTAMHDVNAQIRQYRDAHQDAKASALELALAAARASGALDGIASKYGRMFKDLGLGSQEDFSKMTPREAFEKMGKAFDDAQQKGSGRNALHPGGGGGTTVQKVEIVVTSNQEPSRIARAVEIEFTKKLHRSGRSPDVANYSRPSGT